MCHTFLYNIADINSFGCPVVEYWYTTRSEYKPAHYAYCANCWPYDYLLTLTAGTSRNCIPNNIFHCTLNIFSGVRFVSFKCDPCAEVEGI